MNFSHFKMMSTANIPSDSIRISKEEIPQVVKENISDIENCTLYLSIACWDGSWMYTAFNRKTVSASRVTVFNVVH